jgi:hypothetical protein
MNIPVKIKNKKPWISLSSYSNLLIDSVNFDNYEVSFENSGPEGYFGRSHIDNIVELLEVSYPNKTENYRSTLEVLFHNIEKLIESSLDYLYFTNPVELEDLKEVDIILENSINKMSFKSPQIWGDDLIKNILVGNLSSSFLSYDLKYDPATNLSSGEVVFRYLPEGTECKVNLDLKTSTVPDTVDIYNPDNNIWGEEFLNDIRSSLEKEWIYKFGWNENIYQEELYRSILSGKKPLTINDFYVKSFNLSKYEGILNSTKIEKSPNFSLIDPTYLNIYSPNIIYCLGHDVYNSSTVNPGFTSGVSGWNRESYYSNITTSSYKSENVDLEISDSNSLESNPELRFKGKKNRLSQVLRLPPGKYELTLSVLNTTDRDIKLFFGDLEVNVTLAPSSKFRSIRLTNVENGGIDVTSENSIISYGFEIGEDSVSIDPEILIEYCRIVKL